MSPVEGFYKVLAGMVILVVGLVPTYQRTTHVALGQSAVMQADEQSLAAEKEWALGVREEIRQQKADQRRAARLVAQEQQERQEITQWVHQKAVERHRASRRIEDLAPASFQPMVLEVAEKYELDPRMLAAICQVESQWRVAVRGSHGEIGLMQLTPGTAAWIADQVGLTSYDLSDPYTNLTMGAWYLRSLYREYGNWPQVLAAYNGGPAGAALAERHPYAKLVMTLIGDTGNV